MSLESVDCDFELPETILAVVGLKIGLNCVLNTITKLLQGINKTIGTGKVTVEHLFDKKKYNCAYPENLIFPL